jgi:signal transduction histidine kinase
VFRVAALAYAIGLVVVNHRYLAHPAAAAAALLAMAGWTVVISIVNLTTRSCRWLWYVVDLAVAAGALLFTAYVDSPAGLLAHSVTLTGPWTAPPVLSCAIVGGPWIGLLSSLVIVATTIALPGGWSDVDTLDNLVLLVCAAGAVGLVARLLGRAERRMRLLVEREAAGAERDRLARTIHDGVLQVLALVQRNGPDLGDRGMELAQLAADQEVALRALMSWERPMAGTDVAAVADLRVLLAGLAAPSVLPVMPADAVLLPAPVAAEVTLAVAAALDNVVRHAGPQARAWVVLEEESAAWVVTVRDDGSGIAPGRLAAAAAAGRLGVAQSIRGRIADLGGTTTITSNPGQGTEVEFRIPRGDNPGTTPPQRGAAWPWRGRGSRAAVSGHG